MSILPFDLSKTSIISYSHRNVTVFTTTRQNKFQLNLEDTVAEIYYYSLHYIPQQWGDYKSRFVERDAQRQQAGTHNYHLSLALSLSLSYRTISSVSD